MERKVATTSRGPQAKKKKGNPPNWNRTSTTGATIQGSTVKLQGGKNYEVEEAKRDRSSRENGTSSNGLTPQEAIKEKCPKCLTEISPVKVSGSTRNVVMLCPSCGGKRSRMMTKDGWKDAKQKYDYRYCSTSLYGRTFPSTLNPLSGDS